MAETMAAIAPTLSHVAERLYGGMAPVAERDAEHDYALAHYLQALALMVDEVADLSRDGEDGEPGYSVLFDPDRIPEKLLPWLAQFVGVRLPSGLTAAQKRSRIRGTEGFRRGSVGALEAAARAHLTGDQRLYFTERHGSAYRLTIATLEGETPRTDWTDDLNVVTDSSFEGGALSMGGFIPGGLNGSWWDASWNIDGAPIPPAVFEVQDNLPWVHSGTRALRITTGEHVNAQGNWCQPAVTFSIDDPTEPWTFSVWCNPIDWPNDPANGDFPLMRITIEWYDAAGGWISQSDGPATDASTGATQLVHTETPPANAAGGSMKMAVYGFLGVGDVIFDDVYIGKGTSAPSGRTDGMTPGRTWTDPANAPQSWSQNVRTNLVRDALLAQKPAGIVLTHSVIPGGDFNTLRDTHTDFADVTATFATFDEVRANPAQQ